MGKARTIKPIRRRNRANIIKNSKLRAKTQDAIKKIEESFK